MQAEGLVCNICSLRFNLTDRLPKVLPCGHTFCITCLGKILASPNKRCPNDNGAFSPEKTRAIDFASNYTVIHIIQENSEWEICEMHGERIPFVCMTDRKKVCSFEAFSEHKEHEIRMLDDLKPEFDSKRHSLEDAVENLEVYHVKLGNLLEEQRKNLLKVTKVKFEELAFLVKMKEFEVSSEIDSFFTKEIKRVDKVLGVNSSKRAGLKRKIDSFRVGIQHKDVFSLIDDDIIQDIQSLSKEALQDQIYLLTTQSTELARGLDKTLSTLIDSLENLDFSVKMLSDSLITRHPEDSVQYVPKPLHLKLTPFESKTSLVLTQNPEFLEITAGKVVHEHVVIKPEDLKSVKKVIVGLEDFGFNEDDMKILGFVLRAIPQISCVKLNAQKQKMFTDEWLVSLFNIIFWKPQDLIKVKLNFDWRKIGDYGIIYFVENVLPKSENLRSMNFNLYRTSITGEVIKALAKKAFPYMKVLENLNINIGDTGLSDREISQLFVSLPSIRKFKLGLSSTKIGDAGMEAFAKNMLPSMVKLQKLHLRLLGTKVNNASIMHMMNKINGVESVTMDLSHTEVTDETVRAIVQAGFLKAKALRMLAVDLTNTKVTEDMKEYLKQTKKRIEAGV